MYFNNYYSSIIFGWSELDEDTSRGNALETGIFHILNELVAYKNL
jgi:hypothetical protein